MTTPPKRIVTVVLTPREQKDAEVALQAVREALRANNQQFRVYTRPEAPRSSAEGGRGHALGQLEIQALNLAAQTLDEKAREIERAKALGASQAPAAPPSSESVKKIVWEWLKEMAKAGWQVTVVATLEWVKKQVIGS
jgi:sRNA-binding protein